MDHIYPGAFEEMSSVIENLIALPRHCRRSVASFAKKQKQRHADASTVTEERLSSLAAALAEKQALLAERERILAERDNMCKSSPLVHMIPLGAILPPANVRCMTQEPSEDGNFLSLCASVGEDGMRTPLTVRRVPSICAEDTEGKDTALSPSYYTLLSGTRRLRAASALGWKEVPAVVLADGDRESILLLVAHLQSETLDMFTEAAVIASLLDTRLMTRESLACALGVSPSAVSNKMRLLSLSAMERETVLAYHLSRRHARAFLRIKEASLRREVVLHTAIHHLTVAETEQFIEGLLAGEKTVLHPVRFPEKTRGGDAAMLMSGTPTDEKCFTWNIPQTNGAKSKKLVMRDLAPFFNSLDRLLLLLLEAGIPAHMERTDTDDEACVSIRVEKPQNLRNIQK